MSTEPASDFPRVVEEILDAGVPALVHPLWADEMPWLVQGTTTRRSPDDEDDFGIFTGAAPADRVRERWDRIVEATGLEGAIHARQPHGSEVRYHAAARPGLHIAEPCDGHVTDRPGTLLAVATADCVPVFVVAPRLRVVAVLHAGWRGVAAGVLERGLALLVERSGAPAGELLVHFGPAICGSCYEVGAEVFAALAQPVLDAPRPIDLRAVLAGRAVRAGVDPGAVTVSAHCTRCTGSRLFSHRGGDRGRQVGYVGIRS